MIMTLCSQAAIFIALATLCLNGCSGAQLPPAASSSQTPPSGANSLAPTASQARRQNWHCERIERATASLEETMRIAKARAEHEQAALPATIARAFDRMVGPPGAGNAALLEFREVHRDADQLNALLSEKGCAQHRIDVEAPAFLRR